jgi:exopolysaccharide biosynthesis polyprenyl glycosylphosphotransferase
MSKDALGVNRGREGHRPIQRALRRHRDRRISLLPGQPDARCPRWQRSYRRAAIVLDMIAVAVSSALYSQWGTADNQVVLAMGAAVLVLTACSLGVARAWDPLVLGHSSAEFSRLLRGFLGAAVVVALLSLASQLPAGRPWVFAVLPIAGALATFGRLGLRRELYRRRCAGATMARVLAVGTEEAVAALVAQARRSPYEGWRITGACTPTGRGECGRALVAEVPVIGDLDAVAALARSRQFDTVSVALAPGITPRRLQQLAWDLQDTQTELVVEPGLMEIAGLRLHVDSLDGLPLLWLTRPTFTGASRLLKGLLDRVAALLLLVVTAPLLIAIAIAVALDGGPIFVRQVRVGAGGREFKMIKFRSRIDSRTSRIDQFLRRFSLDELPQLFNVLGGSMSLVGPRPPLPSEVAEYTAEGRRRLLVKPGMTGLRQVSGRSDMTWDEALRTDLRYVENWMLALDARIIVKTLRAVLTRTRHN